MTPAPPPASSISFGTLARGARRHALTTAFFVLLAAAAGAGVWLFLPLPNMTGQVMFRISNQPTAVISPTPDAMVDFGTYRSLQAASIRSKQVVVPVLADPQVAGLASLDRTKVQDPAAWLATSLKVDFPQSTEIMRVSIEGNNKDELLAIIKAVKDVYIKEVVNKDRTNRATRLEQLNTLHQKYADELKDFQKNIRNARLQLQAGDPITLAMRERFLESQIASAQQRLNDVINTMREQNVGMQVTKAVIAEPARVVIPDELVTEFVRGDAEYVDLDRRKAAAASAYTEMAKLAVANAESPKMRDLKVQIADLDRRMAEMMTKKKPETVARFKDKSAADDKQTLAAFEQRMKLNEEYRKVLELDVTALINQRKDMNSGQFNLESLKDSISHTQAVADRIQTQVQQLRPELDAPTRVTLWEEPSVVAGIEGNRRSKYTAMAVGSVFLIGLVLVTWLEHRNRRVQSPDDLSAGTGLRVIGTVPAVPRRAFAGHAAGEWQYHLTEAVDTTRTMLLSGSQTARRILVSSAVSGEGKTSLTTHLAVSLARAGLRVLLIDADMRRPAVHRVFGLTLRPGLAEVLTGRAVVGAAIQVCRVPGLHVIPGGSWQAEAAAALSSPAWDDLIGRVGGDYDFILIDSPPILPVADALAIARKVDGVVMAVMRDVSRFAAIETARQRLAMVGANILGVVVSGVAVGGYYYDRYYSQPTAEAEAVPTTQV